MPATRGRVIQTVMEAFGVPLPRIQGKPYTDVSRNHPNAAAIIEATQLGIVNGDTDESGKRTGTFRPNDPINRAEVAKILVRLLGKYITR